MNNTTLLKKLLRFKELKITWFQFKYWDQELHCKRSANPS